MINPRKRVQCMYTCVLVGNIKRPMKSYELTERGARVIHFSE